MGIIYFYQDISTATVDNILCLKPVEMVRAVLPLFHIEQLFRIDLRILFRQLPVSVADGNQRHADFVKITQAVIRDIPAQPALSDFIQLMPCPLPFIRRQTAERRKKTAVLYADFLKFL